MTRSIARSLPSLQPLALSRTRQMPWTSRAAVLATLAAIVASGAAGSGQAQLLSFTSRNGSNLAYCGPLGSGLLAQHNFATPLKTHDSISFSDPGNAGTSPSATASQLEAIPAAFGISLAHAGNAMRGPVLSGPAPSATADARDVWEFTLTMPARFTLSASLNAASSDGIVAAASYLMGPLGGGGQILPDPGTPPGAFGNALTSPGSFAVSASGTLTAGHYFIQMQSRVDGNNSFPYSGSYANSMALALECGTLTSYCTSGTTSNGCLAQIQGNGTPRASATSGFTLDVIDMEGGVQGLIFYGVSGRSAVPWGTSSSFVCVKSPTQRTLTQSGGGTLGSCNGAMSLDWNAYVSSHPGALGVPFSAGQVVQAQGWFRDSPSPKTTNLSDALEFVVCP